MKKKKNMKKQAEKNSFNLQHQTTTSLQPYSVLCCFSHRSRDLKFIACLFSLTESREISVMKQKRKSVILN